ncbi:zinc finger protein ZAT1-like [Canna indica]|uniref:Zinc finger protein ZAT1-like n=1 Tax=Canna indica TaxID=4628 RepID=A0AAQ3KX64_9LILI|nr:zinc finger protein ZAT1-like [Canna indica]
MERHRCKLCRRRFSNGRALGGHMRSHAHAHAHAPPPPPVPSTHRPLPSPSASSSSFSAAAAAAAEEGKAAQMYGLRENPRRSLRITDPEFSAGGGSSSIVQDGESDVESSLRRWPKHRPRGSSSELAGDAEPRSTVSHASAEEDHDVAHCLMLLSRDSWSRSELEDHQFDYCDEVDGTRVEQAASGSWQRRTRSRTNQKRPAADGTPTTRIRIYQGEGSTSANAADLEAKLFQCPYCDRIFSSGQALGGHKRTHLSTSAASATTNSPAPPPPNRSVSSLAVNDSGIDLNLPNPSEEEEAEISAVSVTAQFQSK